MLSSTVKSKKIISGLVIIMLFWCFSARAQQSMEVGLFGGGSYYIGDLNPSMPFRGTKPAFGVLARWNLDTRWTVKFGITRGAIEGDASTSGFLPDRQLVFESPVTDFSAVVEFNFFKYFTGSKYNWITPYIFGGIGGFMFDPSANGVNLRGLGTEGQNIGYLGRSQYSTTAVSLPFGAGVKMSLTKKLGLTAYWELHKTFTDYLDDVSTTYYLNGASINPDNPEEIYSDPPRTHDQGMERGNPNNNDWYSFAGVTITYKFNLRSSRKCKETYH